MLSECAAHRLKASLETRDDFPQEILSGGVVLKTEHCSLQVGQLLLVWS